MKVFTPKENYSPTSVNLVSGGSILVDDGKESLHPERGGTALKKLQWSFLGGNHCIQDKNSWVL